MTLQLNITINGNGNKIEKTGIIELSEMIKKFDHLPAQKRHNNNYKCTKCKYYSINNEQCNFGNYFK